MPSAPRQPLSSSSSSSSKSSSQIVFQGLMLLTAFLAGRFSRGETTLVSFQQQQVVPSQSSSSPLLRTMLSPEAPPAAAASSSSSSSSLLSAAPPTATDLALVREHLASEYTWDQIKPLARLWTMVHPDMLGKTVAGVVEVDRRGIEGAIVECGVWRGGMTMGMIYASILHRQTHRHFYLFDTFDGMARPTDAKNGPLAFSRYDEFKSKGEKWAYGPYQLVLHNLRYTGYPPDQIHLVPGKVEDTLRIPANLPDKIAILRLDTDWYESTKLELEILYSRLQSGGLLIIDDYCSWKGAREATLEFFRDTLGIDAEKIKDQKPCLHYWKP